MIVMPPWQAWALQSPRWTPQTPPNLYAWWEADTVAYPTALATVDASVSTLNDLSGGAHHRVQATGAKQPAHSSITKRITYSAGTMWLAYGGAIGDFAFMHAASHTTLFVWNPSALAAGDNIIFDMNTFLGGLGSRGMFISQNGAAGAIKYLVGNGGGVAYSHNVTTAGGLLVVGTAKVICVRQTAGVKVDIWCGGGAPTTVAEAAALGAGNPDFGLGSDPANVSSQGSGGGQLIYQRAVTIAEVNSAAHYLAARYSATWTTATE